MERGLANVFRDGENSERGEIQVVPRRHSGGVVGHAPRNRNEGDARRGQRAEKLAGYGVYGRNPEYEKDKQGQAKPDELDPENLENQSIEKSQAAGVGISEIEVRDFAVENAFGRLAEGAVVIGKPAVVKICGQIGNGKQPDG